MEEDITETINFNKTLPRWRGFRQMVNYDENAVKKSVDKRITKNLFGEQIVRENFKRLEAAGGSFDLMMEAYQYKEVFETLETVPDLKIILCHRGIELCKHPADPDFLKSQEYWDAMKKFAARPNTYMKLSMFGFSDISWKNGDMVIEKAIELVKLFGPERCMFGTNYPVDNLPFLGGWTMKDMLKTFNAIAKNFTPEEQARLYYETALEAYRMKG